MRRRGLEENTPSAPVRRPGAGGGNNKRRLEVIEYGDEDAVVDHKGRAKPLYKASRPRPKQAAAWRPSRLTRLLLGAFPGVRAMALTDVRAGAWFTVLGIAAAVAAAMLWVSWSHTVDNLETFRMQPRWLLVHAAALFGAIVLFELLRLLSALDDTIRGPAAPRILAAFLIPSVAVLLAAPRLVGFWPRLVEATFGTAVILTAGALPAATWSIGIAFVRSPSGQRRLAVACIVLAVLCLGGLGAAVVLGGSSVSTTLRASGFELLPALIARVAGVE